MNHKLSALLLCLIPVFGWSQETTPRNSTALSPESGLQFQFNNGAYKFDLGGFFQPSYRWEQTEGAEAEHFFNAKRAFFRIGGEAVNEKVSFLIQTNFSEVQPLLDAWVAYHPNKKLTIYMGQRQTFANNFEMRMREDRLQLTERSELSTQFSRSGREFGLFVEGRFGNKFGWAPMVAITSGDGRNSFGVDSRDTDIGGLKYAARLDVFPLGYFSEGNDLFTADLLHEQKPKLLVGGAISSNRGASNRVGEGHGDFLLFNENGDRALPNYQQIYVDVLAKYKGFSFLGEFVNASASGLGSTFLDANATQRLAPQQVSSLMALGNGFNTQVGYVTKKGYSYDMRYGQSMPEFAAFANGTLQDLQHLTFGFSKYFRGNTVKAQTSISLLTANGQTRQVLEVLLQMGF